VKLIAKAVPLQPPPQPLNWIELWRVRGLINKLYVFGYTQVLRVMPTRLIKNQQAATPAKGFLHRFKKYSHHGCVGPRQKQTDIFAGCRTDYTYKNFRGQSAWRQSGEHLYVPNVFLLLAEARTVLHQRKTPLLQGAHLPLRKVF